MAESVLDNTRTAGPVAEVRVGLVAAEVDIVGERNEVEKGNGLESMESREYIAGVTVKEDVVAERRVGMMENIGMEDIEVAQRKVDIGEAPKPENIEKMEGIE